MTTATSFKANHAQQPSTSNTSSSVDKLRILVVCHAYVTGVNQGKLDALVATKKADIALLVPKSWKSVGWGKIKKLEKKYSSIKFYPSDIVFSGRVGAYFYWPSKVWQVISDFQPDLIHVEQEVFSLCALEIAFFAKLFNKPLSVFGWENMERQLSPLRQLNRRYVFDKAQLMISGNKDGETILRQWGYEGRIEIMPQIGVDVNLFPRKIRLGSNDVLKVGFMGRLVHQKGVDLIFDAAHYLRNRGKLIQVIVCGSGVEEQSLRQKASALDIEDMVTWRSGIPHEDVPQEMDKLDVLILPSRTIASWKEQFGHVLIEAMSMGIPVVGSDSGEIPNVIGDPNMVFPEDDAIGLASILECLSNDSELYTRVSQYCVDRVEKLYSHECIAHRLIRLWNDALIEFRTSES